MLSGLQAADTSFLERIRRQYDLEINKEGPDQPYTKPALILTGRQDHVVGYQDQWKLTEEFPHATFVALDRAGHNLHIEQNQLFHPLVSEWLDQVVESRLCEAE
ncbi:alpha/beta fold hydrolase [Metabacillus sp. RGM 3146]|uniref:alpha/beta fold hydrolase n=1 Tax=Metabacillus sp. RGM 3146 TaxID=3401092 RepID=UPI003B9D04AB